MATIEHAFQLAKTFIADNDVTIKISEGRFPLRRTLSIDSTWALRGGRTFRIAGSGIGKTIISGGIELPGFVALSDSLWCVDLAGTPFATSEFKQLYVNGRRSQLARTPKRTEMFRRCKAKQIMIDSVPVRGATRNGLFVHEVKLREDAYNVISNLNDNVSDTYVSFLHAWDMTRRRIETFNAEDSAIYVIGNPMKPWNPIDRKAQFFFENNFAFLDEQGEWFYDKADPRLFYIPRDAENVDSSVAVVPLLKNLLTVCGSEDSSLENIQISDVTFSDTAYPYSRRGDDPVQAAAKIDAAISVTNAANFSIDNSEVRLTGNTALWFDNGCRESRVSTCYFHDLGAGAIKMGRIKMPENESHDLIRNITIDNNIFHSGGRIFPSAVAVLLMHASDVEITHNDIADFYYSGVSVGWVWGYAHSPSKHNKISYNHIHHIGRGVLSDMGGIYTLGKSEGTVIENNVVHHVYSYSYGGWGIYTDEGSSGILIRNNLVYSCKSSGFHQHYGKDNLVINNIFVNQMHAQLEATEIEPHNSFSFTRNIVYYKTGDMYGIKWDSVNAIVDNNAYWCASGNTNFNNYNFEQWKKHSNKDLHSIIANPQFSTLKGNSVFVNNKNLISKLGFSQLKPELAGVYGSELWIQMAQLPHSLIKEFDEIVSNYESAPDKEKPNKMQID
ncbi:MAG: right-handed parallel beta-helix repeat-containing protein [Muribaculum sp.]|nr:right-handed parallel beta-helix repeat-containing protein [Muribaculaceae bacterium]MCM1080622.1 right-handed parallel beta-helix repeat-containing protein [Muribaculum sp.]